jgi:hypothetical protein
MKINDIIKEDVSQQELSQIEVFANRLWHKYGIDIAFTKHFLDRVNDSRNKKPISAAELVRLFKKEYERNGKKIASLDNGEQGVFKDTSTDINIPFAVSDRNNDHELFAKTIMRKKNFASSSPVFAVEEDPCWKGYKQYGTKKKGKRTVPNCVPVSEDYDEYNDEAGMADNNLETIKRAAEGLDDIIAGDKNLPEWCQEKIAVAKYILVSVWDYMLSEENQEIDEDWQKTNKKDKTDGMSKKAVNAYRRENPGSKLKTAVTTKPSKLKKGSKDANRRKSFCARSNGQRKQHNIDCSKTPDKPICKARKRWNC